MKKPFPARNTVILLFYFSFCIPPSPVVSGGRGN